VNIEFQVQVKVMKPVAQVFDAVVDPGKLSAYFIGSSTGPLEQGKTVNWRFAEFPDFEVPVTVQKLKSNELIQFAWEGETPDYQTTVLMTFEPLTPDSTLISIKETGWRETESGLAGSYRNCFGWTHMGMCMKAYLDFGIDLRKNSFEPSRWGTQ